MKIYPPYKEILRHYFSIFGKPGLILQFELACGKIVVKKGSQYKEGQRIECVSCPGHPKCKFAKFLK